MRCPATSNANQLACFGRSKVTLVKGPSLKRVTIRPLEPVSPACPKACLQADLFRTDAFWTEPTPLTVSPDPHRQRGHPASSREESDTAPAGVQQRQAAERGAAGHAGEHTADE